MNFLPVLLWWLMMQGLGWAALPIVFRAMRWLPDRGYIFSKAVGLLLVSYLVWIGASTGFLRNDMGGILAAILLLVGISTWLLLKVKEENGQPFGRSLVDFLWHHRSLILTTEALFTIALFSCSVLRAYASFKIQPACGEKFMEIAFLNASLNSPNFPPLDPWLSGFAISYYYFGYVMMVILTRLSGVETGVGFDLYDALLFALTLVGVFGVVYNLVAGARARRQERGKAQLLVFGLIGALLVGVMGNLEGILEVLHTRGLISRGFLAWIDIPDLVNAAVTGSWDPASAGGSWFWWWRASRVLQDRDLLFQPIGNSPITEFPLFSFLLGDNHPHVLALPFVLLSIALGLNLLRMQLSCTFPETTENTTRWNPVVTVFQGNWPLFGFYALSFGALGFLNTWDMPIYIGLAALSYAAGDYYLRYRLGRCLILRALAFGVGLITGAALLYLFFHLGFSSQAGGILPHVFPPTRLQQYLVIFGIFIFIIACFLITYLLGLARLQQPRSLLSSTLRAWVWVFLGSITLFLVGFLPGLLSLGLQGITNGNTDFSAIQRAIGMDIRQALSAMILARLSDPWLFLLLTLLLGFAVAGLVIQIKLVHTPRTKANSQVLEPQASDIFVFLMIFVGLALTLGTEFFYLRDVFGVRMNTVFKLYYQGWVLLGCASTYAIWWIFNFGKLYLSHWIRNLILLASGIFILAGMAYPLFAIPNRAEYFNSQPDLDGSSQIARSNPDDWAAIQWLHNNVLNPEAEFPRPRYGTTLDIPVILEAPGGNYNYEGRISAFTGLPAVLGWASHEYQWRGSNEEQSRRTPDIQTIYTTIDPGKALELLGKYRVRFVILGATEQNYIRQLLCKDSQQCNITRSLRKFDAILRPVFQQGSITIYEVPTQTR